MLLCPKGPQTSTNQCSKVDKKHQELTVLTLILCYQGPFVIKAQKGFLIAYLPIRKKVKVEQQSSGKKPLGEE